VEIGCSLKSLGARFAEGLLAASKAEISLVEIDWDQVERQVGPNGNVARVAGYLKEYGLTAGAICAGSISAERPDQSLLQIKKLKAIFEKIKAIGTDLAVITGGARTLENFNVLADLLREVISDTDQIGMNIALANKLGSRVERRRDLLALFLAGRSRRAGLCLDTYNFHIAGVNPADIVADHIGRIRLVRISDAMGTVPVQIGKGEIDLKGLIDRLRQIDYDGPLMVDNLPAAAPDRRVQQLLEAKSYLESLLK
jgi:sugar phosphate isomerase/epimerase